MTLTVLGTDGTRREVTLTRATIQQKSVTWEMLDGQIALITVKNFYSNCAQQGRQALEEAQQEGARAVIFDMRNDPGGYITELTDFLDAILPEGTIFRTSGRSGGETTVESDAQCVDLPMAVLVNEDSYSAAEFFCRPAPGGRLGGDRGVPHQREGVLPAHLPPPPRRGSGPVHQTYRTGDGVSLIGTGLTLDVRVDLSEEDAALLSAGALPHEEDEQLQAAIAALDLS